MDVLGELIVRPTLDDGGDRGRAGGDRRGDPLVPRRSGRVRPDPVPAGDVRRRRRSVARSAATRTGSGPCPTDDDPRLLARRRTGRRTRSSRSPATSTTIEAVELAATAFGTRQRRGPGLRRGARRCRPASATPLGRARHEPGPAHRRRPGAPPRPSRRLDPGRPERGPRRRDVQPAVPVGPRGAGPRLRRVVGARRLRRCRLRSRSRPGSIRRGCRRRSRRSSSSSPGCATSRSRPTELAKAKALPVGRPRAADGRDPPPRVVDRRPGGAPRPRPRPSTRRSPPSPPSTPRDVQRLAGELFRDEALRLAAVAPARYLRGLERRLRLPA